MGLVGRQRGRGPAAGRRRIERRVYVRASPHDVWTALHDPASLPALFPELTLGQASPSWPAAGSERTGGAHLGLLRVTVRIESLEARPETTFRLAVRGDGFIIDWGWRMEPIAGGTRVVHDGTFEPRDRWAAILVRLGRQSFDRLAEAHLRVLKERAETRSSAPAA